MDGIMEAHAFGTAPMHPHTLSTYPKAPRIGTIPGPTWDPRTVHAVPHPIQVGPMYYSGGVHVGPTYYSGRAHASQQFY